jgi:hypothetical protein
MTESKGIEGEALRECPFCGEKEIFLNDPTPHHRYGSINCPACLVVMPGDVSDQNELIGCWNTRANLPHQPEDTAPGVALELAKSLAYRLRNYRGGGQNTPEIMREAADLIDALRLAGSGHAPAPDTAVPAAPDGDGTVREAFRAVDETDWAHLDQFIPHSAHGRFWRTVFAEIRAALSHERDGGK